MVDRRSLLRGLVSLPLIGGGVTLIGRPAAAVPLVQAAALPTFDDPRQRARYAWEGFTSAMNEVAAGLDGWHIRGGSRLTPIPHFPYRLEVETWGTLGGVRYEYEERSDPTRPFVSEHVADLGFAL